VHLVAVYYKNMSRCTVLWMANTWPYFIKEPRIYMW